MSAWLRTGLMQPRHARLHDRWTSTVLTCAVLLVVGAHAAQAGVNVWTAHGPYGGHIVALAIDPLTPSTLYAGTEGQGGGVFRSTDSGATWTITGLPGWSVPALGIDPLTPSTPYAGTYGEGGGVFRSTNSGATWTNTGLPPSTAVWALAMDPLTPSTLYAGTYGG